MAKTDFETGICVGMLLGSGTTTKDPVIKSLSVTTNGYYEVPAGTDGYSPVTVNVPDRYHEGYTAGYSEGETVGYSNGYTDGVNSVVINSLSVTENGTYNAADYGCNGFDPVNVNVPAGGYTLPSTVSAAEFIQFVGGNASVSDETTGAKLVWLPAGNGYKKLCVTNGMAYLTLLTMPTSAYLIKFTIDSSTGKFNAKSNTGSSWSSAFGLLVGFGDPSHTNVATNTGL